jgi:hypothetical protein
MEAAEGGLFAGHTSHAGWKWWWFGQAFGAVGHEVLQVRPEGFGGFVTVIRTEVAASYADFSWGGEAVVDTNQVERVSGGVEGACDNGDVTCQNFELIPVEDVQLLFTGEYVVELAGATVDANEGAATAMRTSSEVKYYGKYDSQKSGG